MLLKAGELLCRESVLFHVQRLTRELWLGTVIKKLDSQSRTKNLGLKMQVT